MSVPNTPTLSVHAIPASLCLVLAAFEIWAAILLAAFEKMRDPVCVHILCVVKIEESRDDIRCKECPEDLLGCALVFCGRHY